MEELDLRRLRQGMQAAKVPVTIRVHLNDRRPELSQTMSRIVGLVEIASVGKVVVRPGDGLGVAATPAISLGTSDFNIHYLARPIGHQAAAFVDAVISLAKDERRFATRFVGMESLTEQMDLAVFIASGCPHCPMAVRSALNLALTCPKVNLSIIDAKLYDELADEMFVRSVPVTIFDRGLTLTGVRASEELARESVALTSADGQARVILSMVQARRLDDVFKRLQTTSGIEGFAKAWSQSTTATRIGLMLVAQKLLESDGSALDSLVPNFVDILSYKDAALRGDTADLLGQIGQSSAIEELNRLLEDPNPDVAEIAQDALEQISSNLD